MEGRKNYRKEEDRRENEVEWKGRERENGKKMENEKEGEKI